MLKRFARDAFAVKTVLLAVALAVPAGTTATAQVTIDMAKVTCSQFALFKVSDPDTIAIWLHGYYSGKRDNTVVDVETLKTNTKKLRDYCLENQDEVLLDAVEKLLAQ